MDQLDHGISLNPRSDPFVCARSTVLVPSQLPSNMYTVMLGAWALNALRGRDWGQPAANIRGSRPPRKTV